jgi:hypothetical protein
MDKTIIVLVLLLMLLMNNNKTNESYYGLSDWDLDSEVKLDDDEDEYAKKNTCVPIGEGENCW